MHYKVSEQNDVSWMGRNGFIPPQQSWVPDLEIIETVFTHSAWSIPMGFLTSEHVSFHQQGLQQSAMTFSPLAQKLNMNL